MPAAALAAAAEARVPTSRRWSDGRGIRPYVEPLKDCQSPISLWKGQWVLKPGMNCKPSQVLGSQHKLVIQQSCREIEKTGSGRSLSLADASVGGLGIMGFWHSPGTAGSGRC